MKKRKRSVFELPADIDKYFEKTAKEKGLKPNALKIMALVEYAKQNKSEEL